VYGALESVTVLWRPRNYHDIINIIIQNVKQRLQRFLFGVHCVEEGDRIPPPLQSYGQALKQKDCFSGVLGDDCGASANLLEYY